MWRQLWRVIEKSDFLMQIVDARNPEFFYASDLDQYIKDVAAKGNKKQFVLLINKSDFLSAELRKHWNEYFKEKGVQHLFFSALAEQEKLDLEDEEIERQTKDQQIEAEADSDSGDDEEKRVAKEVADELEKIKLEDAKQQNKQNTVFTNEFMEADEQDKAVNRVKRQQEADLKTNMERIESGKLVLNSTHLFNRSELMALLKHYSKDQRDRFTVGTVGYPNVGKSSVINVLCGSKRVGVANRPGKTKHFQTLIID